MYTLSVSTVSQVIDKKFNTYPGNIWPSVSAPWLLYTNGSFTKQFVMIQ